MEEDRIKGKKGKLPELQKPNVNAEVYNNKKSDWIYIYPEAKSKQSNKNKV